MKSKRHGRRSDELEDEHSDSYLEIWTSERPSDAEAKPGEDGVPHVVWLVGNEAPAYARRSPP